MDSRIFRNEDVEIELFINALALKYGYDFRDYSRAHMKRRILHRLQVTEECETISDLTYKTIYDEKFTKSLIKDFSINVTEMFRDPYFYQELREKVIPLLATYPYIKIWHAGCSTGEEVYSMAILLKEAGIYDRVQIYATDFNDSVLEIAKSGVYKIDLIKDYTRNYQTSGGKTAFSNYYTAKYNHVKLNEDLKQNILFSNHNLVTDSVFGEMHLVLCRNVMIYFNKELQQRVYKLFYESLIPGGILGIGSKETIKFSEIGDKFEDFVAEQKIYRKKRYI